MVLKFWVVFSKLPQNSKENGLGGGFERGTFLIKGLSQRQAKYIFRTLQQSSIYNRASTHGKMIFGLDLEPRDYVTTQNETFRHVLFSFPLPYKGTEDTSEKLDSGTYSLQAMMDKHPNDKNNLNEYEQMLNDEQYQDHLFYFHLKPESYGTADLASIAGHSYSYLNTRVFSQYKKEPGYYGENTKSENGSFVIDVSQDPKEAYEHEKNIPLHKDINQIVFSNALYDFVLKEVLKEYKDHFQIIDRDKNIPNTNAGWGQQLYVGGNHKWDIVYGEGSQVEFEHLAPQEQADVHNLRSILRASFEVLQKFYLYENRFDLKAQMAVSEKIQPLHTDNKYKGDIVNVMKSDGHNLSENAIGFFLKFPV